VVDVLVARAACSSRTKSKKHCKQVIVVYSAIAICIAFDPCVKQEGFLAAGICPQNGLPVATTPQRPTPWKTVYYHFRRWEKRGVLAQIRDTLVQQARAQAGKAAPKHIAVDSQSVPSTAKGGTRV
jgi:transposase